MQEAVVAVEAEEEALTVAKVEDGAETTVEAKVDHVHRCDPDEISIASQGVAKVHQILSVTIAFIVEVVIAIMRIGAGKARSVHPFSKLSKAM